MSEAMDELQARVNRQLERMRDLGDQLAKIRGSETSEDGAVTAVVDGNGALLDLDLTQAISRMTPEMFASVVTSTAAAAAASAFAQRGALVEAFNSEVAETTSNVHPEI